MSHPRRKTLAVHVGRVTVGGAAPIVVQSMTNTDTADIEAPRSRSGAGARRLRTGARHGQHRRGRGRGAADPRPARAARRATCRIIGDFHYNGHKLLREYPDCAEALAKYRINPGNVGLGSKRDRNSPR